ncbi:ribbon-helix-helix domain-containing protein [Parvularcula maris]|uniref:Ribbon-helix-helix domain-containing protein n=1 Tax=Parvularcula maris TaxID=2965077 RepID=A0A9X2LDJ7_9PROT|nr:ribbon-helix-helix domain-containing protein [Parvularcula maris]
MTGEPGDQIKRSVTLAGHRTSVRLERLFWDELERLAERRSVSLAKLIAEADVKRSSEQSLASALRVEVVEALRQS